MLLCLSVVLLPCLFSASLGVIVHVHAHPVYYSKRGRHYVGNDVVDESYSENAEPLYSVLVHPAYLNWWCARQAGIAYIACLALPDTVMAHVVG